jgi:hypothetical protein
LRHSSPSAYISFQFQRDVRAKSAPENENGDSFESPFRIVIFWRGRRGSNPRPPA